MLKKSMALPFMLLIVAGLYLSSTSVINLSQFGIGIPNNMKAAIPKGIVTSGLVVFVIRYMTRNMINVYVRRKLYAMATRTLLTLIVFGLAFVFATNYLMK